MWEEVESEFEVELEGTELEILTEIKAFLIRNEYADMKIEDEILKWNENLLDLNLAHRCLDEED